MWFAWWARVKNQVWRRGTVLLFVNKANTVIHRFAPAVFQKRQLVHGVVGLVFGSHFNVHRVGDDGPR